MSNCPVPFPHLYVPARALLIKMDTVLETELQPTTNENQDKTPNSETERMPDDGVISEVSDADALENAFKLNLQKT